MLDGEEGMEGRRKEGGKEEMRFEKNRENRKYMAGRRKQE